LVILRIGDLRGQSALERTIMAFLGLIAIGFLAGLFVNPPQPGPLAGGLVPHFAGAESVLLASGIIGATVMPHVIYLHSSLSVTRLDRRGDGLSVRDLLSITRTDVVLALILAGVLNLSWLVVAAASLQGRPGTHTLSGVHAVITSDLGAGVALLFAVALLGSGLASTSVGSAAGAEVMRGLIHVQIPMVARRIITVIPALVVLALGIEPSAALVVSQVVLSMGIPLALVPLVVLTSRHSVMGEHANHRLLNVGAWTVATIVIGLNLALLWLTFIG
jgi:manganese transport protein